MTRPVVVFLGAAQGNNLPLLRSSTVLQTSSSGLVRQLRCTSAKTQRVTGLTRQIQVKIKDGNPHLRGDEQSGGCQAKAMRAPSAQNNGGFAFE